MAFQIGFSVKDRDQKADIAVPAKDSQILPRKSVVQIYFESNHATLTYYNDRFDLKVGDLVYVEGEMAEYRGRVTNVNYNFKIKISAYKRVISVADTTVSGRFYMAGTHFVTFDRNALPSEKVLTWFQSPKKDEDEFVVGNDESAFYLNDLSGMKVSPVIAERGENYYTHNQVRYISVDGSKGYAVVEGGDAYEVEFEYRKGEISKLVCSCFCSYNCKHEYAAMLQLKETLDLISKHYEEEYEQKGYFAAIHNATLFAFAINNKETGVFVL